MPLRMISTIVLGDAAMGKGTTSPALGAVVHLVLSAAFGVAFGVVVPWLRTNGTVALAGVLGHGAAEAFEELDPSSVPPRWLQVVARAGPRAG